MLIYCNIPLVGPLLLKMYKGSVRKAIAPTPVQSPDDTKTLIISVADFGYVTTWTGSEYRCDVVKSGLHCTMIYATGLSDAESIAIRDVYWDCVNACRNSDRACVFTWTKRTQKDICSDVITGPIDDFKKLLTRKLHLRFGTKIYCGPTEVNVHGDHNRVIYPLYDLCNPTMICTNL